MNMTKLTLTQLRRLIENEVKRASLKEAYTPNLQWHNDHGEVGVDSITRPLDMYAKITEKSTLACDKCGKKGLPAVIVTQTAVWQTTTCIECDPTFFSKIKDLFEQGA
jgi:hypothetical protein